MSNTLIHKILFYASKHQHASERINTLNKRMNNKIKVAPGIRFPEFKDHEEWRIEPLGALSKEITEKTKGRRFRLMSITSGVGLVSQLEKFGREIAGNSYDSYYVIHRNDFAYNKSSTKLYSEGEIAMYEEEEIGAVPNSIFTCFRFDKSVINPVFAKYPFINNLHGKWLRQFIAVGARANGALQVNVKDLFSTPFPFPKLPEQQKIASCFSSLDEVIAAHTQKLDALREHKKGLMQSLFPQEGETVPKKRFPEFMKSGEWMEKKLEDVADIITGNTPNTAETNNYNGSNLFVSPADINENRYITQTKTTLSDIGFAKSRKICPNSVLFVCIGSTIGKIAQNKIECATNQQINAVIPLKGNSSDFLYSLLDNNSVRIASIAGIHAVPIINKTSFSAVELSFPPSLSEQQKIASCFSSIDALITVQTKKIEELKLHKKGLMQGLFPS